MKQTVNNASFLWMVCIGLVTAFFGYVLWINPSYDAANFPASVVFLLGSVAVGVFTFGLMCLTWFISLFKKFKSSYKPFLGFKTSQNILMAVVMLGFMFIELYGLSYKGNLVMAQKEAGAAYQASLVTPAPTPAPSAKPLAKRTTQTQDNGDPWGVQKQVDDVTWTMKVGQDATMTTPMELFNALNEYRVRQGVNRLEWNDKLAGLAQLRCDQQVAKGGLDSHAGFKEYTADQDKMRALGFWDISENASYGYRLSGVHIIEWAYSDPPHDNNQKNSHWTIVGTAVKGTCTDLIFGR